MDDISTADRTGVVFLKAVSWFLGLVYVLCWSLSFYPQPLLNFRRRSTHGTSIDFPTLNVLGFVAYTISTGAFLYSSTIRNQYAAKHPLSPVPTVRVNDFVFALHGAVLCIITYSQFFPKLWGFTAGRRQGASLLIIGIFWGCVFGVLGVTFIVGSKENGGEYDGRRWAWIDVIYAISYVKLVCTVVKYCPQAWLNYKRKSTVGWSIGQILLDFVGGVLSIMQLIIDSSLQADWSGVTGNPAKFALANISIIFDIIFMLQHYVLYTEKRAASDLSTIAEEEEVDDDRWKNRDEERPLVTAEH
ncbi:hypothetical protein K402DRAFT_395857 [Aulographum hederae CBS 113979]|uniref:L-cystine transporter-like protein n=1 Tax=Aulographum hederae CBS 113979 TaxID=1176131 RepID=A0A6G1GTT2_9PEZI|nr:hypothetical protein K402DRAFT_395857 [Aulographum hederae CBS 113979]